MGVVPRFYACNLVTGQIIEEFTEIRSSSPVSALLGDATSCSFHFALSKAPRNWEGATENARSMLVVVLFDHPIWAGIILRRTRGISGSINLDCVSLEGYLARRYTFTQHYTLEDQSSVIAAGLVQSTNDEHGINFEIDAAVTGVDRTRTYDDDQDKTVFSALEDLMNIDNGIEWTVSLDWTTDRETSVTKIFRSASRIGNRAAGPEGTTHLAPNQANAIFQTRGNEDARWEYVEDYSEGKGANHIIAVSSGEGEDRPQSPPAREETLLNAGFPQYELRFTPSTSIINIDTLNEHAHSKRSLVARGAHSITISSRANVYPQIQTDWKLGDDVGFDLAGESVPQGFTGLGRVIGWELDIQANVITPKILLPPLPADLFVPD